jgi:hypothetical protein
VLGVVGDVVVLDRPLVDPRGDRPLGPTLRVQVRKESLPPYALWATILALLVAIAATLVETLAPVKVRRLMPSTTGIGLGFVIAGFDSISMALGAVLAWVLAKTRPAFAENYTVSAGSGVMAGASLAGILIILLNQVFGVLVVP